MTLKIKFKSTTLDQFIERYSVDISHGGIFIRTKDPLPVGTNLKFEFQLKDATPLITGDGTVVWTRDFDPTRSGVAPGMGVRFDRLPSESQEVLEQILAHKSAKLGKPPEAGFLDTPTKVAFGNAPTRVTPKDVLDGLAQAEARRTLLGLGMTPARSEDTTPLPNPLPFHNDLDEFPDEAFEEATKVASLDALARRTAEVEAEDPEPPPFGKSLDDDVTVERRGRLTPGRSRPALDAREARESGGMASASLAVAPAPIFHDLPTRSPFAGDEAEPPAAREGNDRGRPDPFSLPPAERAEPGAGLRTSQRLRIVEPLPPEPTEEPEPQPEEDEAAQPDREGSNMPWIAAAALLLLVGGVTGFWLLSGRDEAATGSGAVQGAAEGQKPAQQEPAAAVAPPAPAPVPVAPAVPQGGVEVTVTSEPDGAIAELVGGAQSGPTPMTFRGLAEGESYQVKVTKAGFQAAELTVKPGAGDPEAVELEAKPAVLRVNSEPAGAQVFINGRRQRSLTPVDVPLSRRLADRKRVTLSLRKAGYSTAEQQVSLDDLVDQGEAMVQEVALVLERRATAGDPDGLEEGGAGDTGSETGDSSTQAGTPASPEETTGDASSQGSVPPEEPSQPGLSDRPDKIPDWMKP